MDDDAIELTVLTPEITGKICAEDCGSKCCNFIISNHYVPVEMVDYANLSRLGLQKFVTFFSSVDRPQLINQPSGDCVFLDNDGLCTIYEYRPLACRKYPFRENKDEVADLPDWCELHHRSSEKLKLERIQMAKDLNDFYDLLQDNIEYDHLMDYLQRDKGTKIYQIPDFFDEREIERENEYWVISAITTDYLDSIEGKIQEFREEIPKDWTIIKLLVYDEDINIIGTIEGSTRESEDIEIPYFNDFPPTYEEYTMLLNLITSTDEFDGHLFGGAYLPDEFGDYVKRKVEASKPLNFEFQ